MVWVLNHRSWSWRLDRYPDWNFEVGLFWDEVYSKRFHEIFWTTITVFVKSFHQLENKQLEKTCPLRIWKESGIQPKTSLQRLFGKWWTNDDLFKLAPHTMYGIFTYLWLFFMVNVGKSTIHGWYEYYMWPIEILRPLFSDRPESPKLTSIYVQKLLPQKRFFAIWNPKKIFFQFTFYFSLNKPPTQFIQNDP